MDRALRVKDLDPLPIKKEIMKRKHAEEEEKFEIDLQKYLRESVKMHNNNSGPICLFMGGDRSMRLSQCIFEI
ncbi:hypothetical protein HHI36_024187 [Cryptolaemus montrouzieri]|uniref:Uncharacterized protein n=1 Tax=Cryptolaemus montrouzieri TaxID=559131 RepID=A0ABD2P3P7_9CUCU